MGLGSGADGDELSRRPVGRPRSSGESAIGPARDEIVAAATRLFAKHGYASTTMKAIAEAAGLRQPSVYYWFRRKEEILRATLAIGRSSSELLERLEDEPGSVAVKLYRFLRADTLELCLSPCDFNEIERAAEQTPEEFEDFWTDYRDLQRRLAGLVAAGIEAGDFVEVEPELTSICLLTLDEGAQKRFRNRHAHRPGAANPFRYAVHAATDYADLVATTSLRSLLTRPDQLEAIRLEASRLDGTSSAVASG